MQNKWVYVNCILPKKKKKKSSVTHLVPNPYFMCQSGSIFEMFQFRAYLVAIFKYISFILKTQNSGSHI